MDASNLIVTPACTIKLRGETGVARDDLGQSEVTRFFTTAEPGT